MDRRDFLRRTATTALGVSAVSLFPGLRPAWAVGTKSARLPGVVRQNVKNLTAQQRSDYINAILALKQTQSPFDAALSYYDQFVQWHKHAFDCNISAAHMSPAFLPWHREFLLLFEAGLQQVSGDPSMAIPYWNWTDDASTRRLFSTNFMGGEGRQSAGWAVTDGPFQRGSWRLNVLDPKSNDKHRFRYLVRRFGTRLAPELPTKKQVNHSLTIPKYDVAPYDPGSDIHQSFRNFLEGWKGSTGMTCTDGLMDPVLGPNAESIMHNGVHIYVGGVWGADDGFAGTMTLNTSLNDPVFWSHHANIDRIWDMWEQTHSFSYKPASGLRQGQNLNDKMWPYRTVGINVRISDLLDISTLGYSYA